MSKRKVGQLNFACTDCHGIVANHWIRGQWLGEPKGQYDHFPTWRTSLQKVWDIRQRFQWCQVNIRADELPPDAKEYGDLEFYLASQNEGLKSESAGHPALTWIMAGPCPVHSLLSSEREPGNHRVRDVLHGNGR